MRKLLLKMLFRSAGGMTNVPVFGVVLLLSIGVGLFWLVQILLDNYLGGLTASVLNVKEELAIFRNPMAKRKEDDTFSTGGFTDKMRLDEKDCAEVLLRVSSFTGVVVSPMIKQSDFTIKQREGRLESVFHVVLLGVELSSAGTPVLPIFDHIDDTARTAFANFNGDDEICPLLLAHGVLPKAGSEDIVELECGGGTRRFKVTGRLHQDDIFPIPLFIVPLAAAQQLVDKKSVYFIAVRVPEGDSKRSGELLEAEFDRDEKPVFIVQHWSEALKPLYAVFRSVGVVISAIVSSLFIITFFFSVALIDLVLTRRRKNIAMLLALGMYPKRIRNTVTAFGFTLGVSGFAGGLVLCLLFLFILPYLPLADKLASVYITDFSFRFSWGTFLTALFLSLATAVLSAWFSGRRVFRIDPIEDIRT